MLRMTFFAFPIHPSFGFPMKKYLLLPLLALAGPAAAQHYELVGRAGLGLLQFGGPDAASTAHVNYIDYRGELGGYTNSPYGGRLGAGFALGVRGQRVGARRGLLALDLGFEQLRSRAAIDVLDYYNGASNTPHAATGTSAFRTNSLTAWLGVGHRFAVHSLELDVLAGPELAYSYGFHEKGSGTYDGGLAWESARASDAFDRPDGRLRGDATVWCHRLGFNASYSWGFINYQGGLLGGSREVYSRTLRLGVAYRLP